jgi:phage shock protein E
MYKTRTLVYALMTSVLVWSGACSNDRKPSGETAAVEETAEPQILEPQAFKAKLDATTDAVLLDVRTPEEIAQGTIPGAVPLDFKAADFEDRIDALDKSKTYLVYCAVGGRSGKAVNLMHEKGFTHVYGLDGGFQAWQEQGLEQTKP